MYRFKMISHFFLFLKWNGELVLPSAVSCPLLAIWWRNFVMRTRIFLGRRQSGLDIHILWHNRQKEIFRNIQRTKKNWISLLIEWKYLTERCQQKKNVSASFAGNFYLEMGVVELRARQLATLGVCT